MTLQDFHVIFMDQSSKDEEEDHPHEDDSDSDEYSPEIDGEVSNEVTDISVKCMHTCKNHKRFAEPIPSRKKYLKSTWVQGDKTGMTAWEEMC